MVVSLQLKRYSEKTAAAVFRQILHAVNYLHERKIVHRDIKPDNVVFKTTIRNSSDFGKDNVRLFVSFYNLPSPLLSLRNLTPMQE